MRTYRAGSIGSILAAGNPAPASGVSLSALRRRIAAALVCGGRKRGPGVDRAPPPSATPSSRLTDLLNVETSESGSDEDDASARIQALEELRAVAKRLRCEEQAAARDVRRLAKEDPAARVTLASLGAIPPLVSMLELDADPDVLVAALYGLLNLGIGNRRNKEAVVSAGAVHKMMDLVEAGCSDVVSDAIVANFLGLTAVDANKPLVGASGAIPFLVRAIGGGRRQAREDALRAIYNLSLAACNAAALVEAGAVGAAAGAIGEEGERAVAVVASLVGTAEGRREAGRWLREVAAALGEEEGEACREKAAYVMMVMAHGGYAEGVKAAAEGALLEAALTGTPLAQRRAARALEWVRVGGKGKGLAAVGDVSAPQCGGEDGGWGWGEGEERKAVRDLVQQSLQSNMRRMARRANLIAAGVGDEAKAVAVAVAGSATSKSLPF